MQSIKLWFLFLRAVAADIRFGKHSVDASYRWEAYYNEKGY